MTSRGIFGGIAACTLALCVSSQPMNAFDIDSVDVDRGFLDDAMILTMPEGVVLNGSGQAIVANSVNMPPDPKIIGVALDHVGVIAAKPVLTVEPENAELAAELGLDRMYLVYLDGDSDSVEASAYLMMQTAGALEAEPVRVGQALTREDPSGPNDPDFPMQYSLNNVGQNVQGVVGAQDADIDAVEAWALTSGAGQVVIAVLDAGVSYDHPDLLQKLEDGFNSTGSGDVDDASDPYNSHGTHVAGIAAANSNNGVGMTGVSWGSPIMPVKIANPLGFTSDVWMGDGLVWAADNGASVVVISFGLDSGSSFLQAAVQYAHAQGVVICASSGNTGQPGVKYPAFYSETIAVGATDSMDNIAPFSTTGPQVTLTAPGVNILSTWDDAASSPGYRYQSGTSAAAPVVAGVAALVLSADPTMSPDEVRDVLKNSAQDLGAPGFDVQYGYGRVNANRAVALVLGIRVCPADVNLSGNVDFSDFAAWLDAYNNDRIEADQNDSDTVEPSDFSAFIANYNEGCY
ncbi:MAG TPA: hypothetical protein ENJ00_08975 [Phycisphaerales bacterium]|nr:hypothetical protein [Phycisphaerales bacterium]